MIEMLKKRLICVTICFALLLGLTGCDIITQWQSANAVDWMPFGLEFGMTYDEFSAKMNESGITVSPLKAADSNDSYVIDGIPLDTQNPSHWEFLHSDTINALAASDEHEDPELAHYDIKFDYILPKIYFSFNQNKELYEFGFMWFVFIVDDEFAHLLISDVIAAYDAKFGIPCDGNTIWETETMGGQLIATDDNTFCLILHDKTHNLTAASGIEPQVGSNNTASDSVDDGASGNNSFIFSKDDKSSNSSTPSSTIPGSTTSSAGESVRIYCYQCGADCTAQGLEADGRCADCNYQDMIADREEPPAQNTPICNHDYLEATCTEPKTCWLCGETTGSPRGHDYRPATCTDPKTCKLCGERTGYALGHDYTAPTCTVPGSCKICGAPGATATGHNWVRVTETVYHEERGHYEDVEVAVKVNEYQCFACSYASQSLSAYYSHFDSTHSADLYADVIRDRYNTIERWTYQTETQWVVDTPAYSETVTAGYRCSVCGEIK